MSRASPDGSLYAEAVRYLHAGLSVVPVRGKIPFFRWQEFQQRVPTVDEVRRWADHPWTTGFAIICGQVSGGFEVLDFDDHAALFEPWVAQVRDAAIALPVAVTGSGGKHLAFRSSGPGRNQKLAYVVDPTSPNGYHCLIETRGEGGFIVAPPSIHPNGARYRYAFGHFAATPILSISQRHHLIAAAVALNQKPPPPPLSTSTDRTYAHYRLAATESIIRRFNATYPIEVLLERNGYQYDSRRQRYRRPGGQSASVVLGHTVPGGPVGKSYHHSANDPINFFPEAQGYWHDAYDLYVYLEHHGDRDQAYRAAATLLNIPLQITALPPQPPQPPQPPPPPPKPTSDPPIRFQGAAPNSLVVLTDQAVNADLLTRAYQVSTIAGPHAPAWPSPLAREAMTYPHRVILFEPDHDSTGACVAGQVEGKILRLPCPVATFVQRATAQELMAMVRVAQDPPPYRKFARA